MIHRGEVSAVAVRTVERAIVAAIVTTVPMIDRTIEGSALQLTVVPTLIRDHLPPGWDAAAGSDLLYLRGGYRVCVGRRCNLT